MKTIKFIISLLILSCLIIGTNLYAQQLSHSKNQQKKPLTEQDKKHQKLLLTPEDKLTKDELALKYRIADFLFDKVVFVDGKIGIINATKKDFARNNIPEYFYENLMTSVDDMNSALANGTITIEDMKKSFEKAKAEYYAKKAKEKK